MTATAAAPPGTEGERWARHELERLRAASFAPRALAEFLGASAARAGTVRHDRPALARQARRWSATGGLGWCALAAAGREPFRRRLAPGLVWWGAVAVMLEWHLGMLETADGRPRPLGPADALTLARAWLVPVVADDLHPAALLGAATTDLLDGVLARATAPTRAGRDLEGLVDSAVFLAALSAAARTGRLAPATVALERLRLAMGVGYSTLAYLVWLERPDPGVTRAARLATPLRVAGLLAAGTNRRARADTLVAAGSLISLASHVRGGRRRRRSPRPGPNPLGPPGVQER